MIWAFVCPVIHATPTSRGWDLTVPFCFAQRDSILGLRCGKGAVSNTYCTHPAPHPASASGWMWGLDSRFPR